MVHTVHPTAADSTEKVLSLHRELEAAPSLKPSPDINRTFTELVNLSTSASQYSARKILGSRRVQKIIPRLRTLNATGEVELEQAWVRTILASTHPTITLEQFPYYENYLKLTELEFRSLNLSGNRPIKHVLFIGSGPLPLSSILMARKFGLFVDNIDNDADASALSTALVQRLGLADVINIRHAEAKTHQSYHRYDAIFLAALVGTDGREKQEIIDAIQQRMKPGAFLVARTAHNLRTLLYPQLDIDDITGLTPHIVIQPLNEVVNSVAIFEKPLQFSEDELVIEDKASPEAIRKFKTFCFDIIANVYRYHYDSTWHFDIDRAEEIYTNKRSNFFVISYQGEVIASAAIRPYDRDYTFLKDRYTADTGSVWRFFVNPQYKELSLESKIQSLIEGFAQQVGFTKLYAHDQRSVPGTLSKYINNGYQVTYESTDNLGTVHFEKGMEH